MLFLCVRYGTVGVGVGVRYIVVASYECVPRVLRIVRKSRGVVVEAVAIVLIVDGDPRSCGLLGAIARLPCAYLLRGYIPLPEPGQG